MVFKSSKIRHADIRVSGKKAFTIKTPPSLPPLHGVFMLCAKRGSGKSTVVENLIRMYKDYGSFHRIILLSPTYYSNEELWKNHINEEDIFEGEKGDVAKIIKLIEEEMDEYEDYIEMKKKWKELMKKVDHDADINDETDSELLEFFNVQSGKLEPPTHKYNGEKPSIAIICDDLQNSAIMKGSELSNLVIKHRHVAKGCGCSIFIPVQNYKARSGGIDKAIRGNATCLLLWKTQNNSELKSIAEEVGGEIDEEKFYELYNYCIQDKYGFMMIDFNPKDSHPSPFRKNLNEFLIYKK